MLESAHLLAVITGFVSSWTLFGASHLLLGKISSAYASAFWKDRCAWDTRVVSTVHAMVTFFFAIACLVQPLDYNSPLIIFGGNKLMELLLCFSVGYFIQDLIVILAVRGPLWNIPDLVHHGTIIVDIFIALLTRTFLFHTVWAYLGELSTPFLNWRYFLDRLGKQSTLIDSLFALTFLLSRPVSFSMQLTHLLSRYHIWQHSISAHVQFAIAACFMVLNAYWTVLILYAVYQVAASYFVKPKKLRVD